MHETAFAKINLALHVRAREPDGYHRIETLFAFAGHGDQLSVRPSADLLLEVDGPFAEGLENGPDNLVIRAAEALRQRFGIQFGATLRLTKRLPVAAGLGGGSADAAAALRLLMRFWGIEPERQELVTIAADLGADVPACLASTLCRGEGRGDRLAAVEDPHIRGLPLLLVNPGVKVSTPAVFKAWDGVDRGALMHDLSLPALAAARNDLEPPAISLAPVIGELLATLRSAGAPLLVRMSGSGATCFALYADGLSRDQASRMIGKWHPSWWQMTSEVRA